MIKRYKCLINLKDTQNFAALALLASSLSPLAHARDVKIDLDETYIYRGTSKGGTEIKIEANMNMTGGWEYGGKAVIDGKTSIWVGGTAYSVNYTQKYEWSDYTKHDHEYD